MLRTSRTYRATALLWPSFDRLGYASQSRRTIGARALPCSTKRARMGSRTKDTIRNLATLATGTPVAIGSADWPAGPVRR